MAFSLNTKVIEPENGSEIKNAVILLHGYGGDGNDISLMTFKLEKIFTKYNFSLSKWTRKM